MGSQAQYLHTLLAMTQASKVESQQHAQRLRWAEMALEALRNVIKNNPGECHRHHNRMGSLDQSLCLVGNITVMGAVVLSCVIWGR